MSGSPQSLGLNSSPTLRELWDAFHVLEPPRPQLADLVEAMARHAVRRLIHTQQADSTRVVHALT